MALTKCPKCNGIASTRSTHCPHCGRRLRNSTANSAPKESKKLDCRINEEPRKIKREKNSLCEINGRVYDLAVVERSVEKNDLKNAKTQAFHITSLPLKACEKLIEVIQVKGEIPRKFDPTQYGIQINLPQCPTCGSANLDKISAFDRGVAFGLFGGISKTARSQFRCKKCGYMW